MAVVTTIWKIEHDRASEIFTACQHVFTDETNYLDETDFSSLEEALEYIQHEGRTGDYLSVNLYLD